MYKEMSFIKKKPLQSIIFLHLIKTKLKNTITFMYNCFYSLISFLNDRNIAKEQK